MSALGIAEAAAKGALPIGPFNPWVLKLLLVSSILITGFGAGWVVNGWRLEVDLSEVKLQMANIKTAQANLAAAQAKLALDDVTAAMAKIHDAADEYAAIDSELSDKFDALRKDFKNATRTPLPTGCKPDAMRVQHLTAAIAAANQAVIGQLPIPTMQTPPKP